MECFFIKKSETNEFYFERIEKNVGQRSQTYVGIEIEKGQIVIEQSIGQSTAQEMEKGSQTSNGLQATERFVERVFLCFASTLREQP